VTAIALGCTAMGLIIAGCVAYACAVRRGHPGRLAILVARAVLITVLAAASVLLWAVVLAGRAATTARDITRHPIWWSRYARARILRPVPRLRGDGDKLTLDEYIVLAGIVEDWRLPAPPGRTRT
jgi:hypothetical protein